MRMVLRHAASFRLSLSSLDWRLVKVSEDVLENEVIAPRKLGHISKDCPVNHTLLVCTSGPRPCLPLADHRSPSQCWSPWLWLSVSVPSSVVYPSPTRPRRERSLLEDPKKVVPCPCCSSRETCCTGDRSPSNELASTCVGLPLSSKV